MNSHTTAPGLGNVMLLAVLVIGLIIAAFLGVVIGETDVRTMVLIFAATTVVVFAVSLHRYVWHISLLLIFLGFSYRPTGFAFGAVELGCLLAAAVAAIFFWQKKTAALPEVLDTPSFSLLRTVILTWLVYVALHMAYNIALPYRPTEFALSNSIKSYFILSAPLAFFYYFSRQPAGIVVTPKLLTRIGQICLVALVVNLAIRVYEIWAGTAEVFVPIINATGSPNVLRTLGPLAMLLGIAALTSDGRGERRPSPFLFWILLIAGTVGCVTSSGRASILLGFGFVFAVLALRRRIALLAIGAVMALLGILVANAFSGYINNRASPLVQRSLQLVLIEKNWETVGTIDSSTKWRAELKQRALIEWRSSPRIFWFGRATYGFGMADENAIFRIGGFEAMIQTALRRGATHNLFTDLLVAYGIVGLALYLALYAATVNFLWKLRKSKRLTRSAADLTMVCLVGAIVAFAYAITAGGAFPVEVIWFMTVLIAAFYRGVGILPEAARLQPASVATVPIRQRSIRRQSGPSLAARRPALANRPIK